MSKGRTYRTRKRRVACDQQKQASGRVAQDKEWTELRGWCRERRMPKAMLTLAYFPETFRGMMATKDICKGDNIVRMPEHLLMTASKAKRDIAIVSGFTQPNASVLPDICGLSEHQMLTYWLYIEQMRGDGSYWRHYVRSLPQDFASVPLFLLSGESPRGEISTTTDSARWIASHLPQAVHCKVVEQQSRLFTDWSRTQMYSSSAGTPIMEDWRRYVWAWLAVSTRCIHLGRNIASQIPAPQDTVALAPFLDFLNHSNEARVTTSFDLASRQFVIRTLTPYKRGCEVFISYGPHDNSFMLAEYGFVLAGNPFQGLELDHYVDAWVATARSNLIASTPGRPAAMQPSDVDHLIHTIEQRGLWRDFVLSPGDSDIPYRLHAALRLLIVAAVDPQHRRQPVSLKREIARWERWLRGEHVDDGEASIRNHAIGSWIKTTCRIIADTSTKMIDDICTFQHAQHAQQTKRGRSVDGFLIRCLLVIWKETNAIAVGNKFYHKSQPAI